MYSINWSCFNDLWDDFWPIDFNDGRPKAILERARRFHFSKQLWFDFPEGPGGTYFFGDGSYATNVWLKDIDYILPFNKQSGQMEFVMFQEFGPVSFGPTHEACNQAPLLECPTHHIPLKIYFYDRPGSPPGNGLSCDECVKERNARALQVQDTRCGWGRWAGNLRKDNECRPNY